MSTRVPGNWRADGILFLCILLATAWFHHQAPGWNVNSRLALTRAITEHRSLAVDEVLGEDPAMETGDTAQLRGRTFSDKTPGASFAAVPAAYAVLAAETLTGPASTPTRRYWITLGSCGLALAAFGVLLRRLLAALLRDGFSADEEMPFIAVPVLVALAACLATPAFYYGSLLMSYAPMLALLAGAALLILRALPLGGQDAGTDAPPWSPGHLMAAGFLLGLSLLMEYIAGLAVAALGLWAWGRVVVAGGRGAWFRFFAIPVVLGLGAFVGWLPFAFYAQAAFGQIAIPYAFHTNEMFRAYMARGFMGINAPNPTVAWLVTVHPYRGLFVQAPWLGLGLLWGAMALGSWLFFGSRRAEQLASAPAEGGADTMARVPGTAPLPPGALLWILASLVATMAYIVFNSGYYMWWGGWSFAPRHLVPVIPFAAGCAALAWYRGGPVWRGLLVAGVAWAILIQWTVMATDPQTPDIGRIGGTTLPRLLEPRLDAVPPWPWTRQVLPRMNAGATSYAYFPGVFRGWIGLIPLALGVLGAGWFLSRPPGQPRNVPATMERGTDE